jgi:hypothetical protein
MRGNFIACGRTRYLAVRRWDSRPRSSRCWPVQMRRPYGRAVLRLIDRIDPDTMTTKSRSPLHRRLRHSFGRPAD